MSRVSAAKGCSRTCSLPLLPLLLHKATSHAESPDWGTLVRCHQRTLNTGVSNIGVIIRQQSMASKLSPDLWCPCRRLIFGTSLTTPLAALHSLRTQPFHEAQPLQLEAKNRGGRNCPFWD
ncbi:hypothetical protein BGW80DRAFT_242928 [Lactifluus volemus]|nr:hypothetical protein BGW80DRAFT_242928 [Lactifluus volemus]